MKLSNEKRVEYAETRAVDNTFDALVLRNGILDAYIIGLDSGYNVRILADGGLGFAASNKWTKKEARKIVEIAYKMAKNSGRKDKIEFAEEKAINTSWEVKQKKKLEG